MSQPADTRANYCYRHPNRQSFVLCQRCGRTICPECQTPGAVGVFCPECMREQRASAPRVKPQSITRLTRLTSGDAPVATYGLMAVSLLSYLIGLLVGNSFLSALVYTPALGRSQPWRMVTTLFVYPPTAIFALLINMLTLWLFGRIVEAQIGRGRFVALYLVSGLGGSAAVALLAPNSVIIGASAAIFGIFGAVMVIQRRLGSNVTGLLILVILNIAIGFIPGAGFVWQSPLGGVLIGGLVGLIYMETRTRARRPLQIGLMIALTVVLFAIGIAV